MTKSIHPGKAACNGILSGQLARLGASSPPTMLEHAKGYLNAYSTDPKPKALTAGLGSKWEILENGFKYYPSILASHSPIQATLALVNKHPIDPGKIASITNETYDTVATHFSNKDVDGVMSARVSVPYCIAVAAVDRQLTQAQFALERIRDPLVHDVLAKTEVIPDAELTKLYPTNFPARVTITLTDGSSFQQTVMFPKGDPQDPLSQEELDAKFHDNARPLLGRKRAASLLSAIYALPEARSVDDVVSRLHP
jgi:2-methylcitrate dehydratase PrpD